MAAQQEHEVRYEPTKESVSKAIVEELVKEVGDSRKKVEAPIGELTGKEEACRKRGVQGSGRGKGQFGARMEPGIVEAHPQRLAPEVQQRLLEALDDMAEVLRSIHVLAERRGFVDDWWSLVQRLIGLRVALRFGIVEACFSEDMDELSWQYDSFVERMLPAPKAH